MQSRHRQVGLDEFAALVVEQPRLVRRDLHARHVFELAVVEPERPVVPGADGAPFVDVPAGEVAAGVRTGVVDDEDLLVLDEDRELKPVDLDVFAFAGFQLVQLAQRRPRHDNTSGGYLFWSWAGAGAGAGAGGGTGAAAGWPCCWRSCSS